MPINYGTNDVSTSGNVGVGTYLPSQPLHVNGNARIAGALYDSNNSAGSSDMVLTSTGSGIAWSAGGNSSSSSAYIYNILFG
jgi:hypothetical protein